MDYKEKLRLAKEALISGSFDKDTIEYIFPELKESEDEKIRKMLIRIYKKADIMGGAIFGEGITYKQVITWLEKQDEKFQYWKPSEEQLEALDYAYNSCPDTERGNYYEGVLETLIDDLHKLLEKQREQKPTPKFKIGDTIHKIGENTVFPMTIEKIEDGDYVCNDSHSFVNMKFQDDYELVEHKPADKVKPKFHESDWIISDTVNKDYHICKIIGIKDGNYTIESIYGYKGYNQFDEFDNVYRLWTIQDAKDGNVLVNGSNIFIFSNLSSTRVMGYCHINLDDGRFYDDKGKNECFGLIDAVFTPTTKEQYFLLFQKMKEAGYMWDAEKKELKKIEQKPAWSEEDEKLYTSALWHIKNSCGNGGKDSGEYEVYNWLESIKNRVQPQLKQEWNEEDEKCRKIALLALNNHPLNQNELKAFNWLRSLKPQSSWKPSEFQLKCLSEVIPQPDTEFGNEIEYALTELYRNLKKL